jgi:hypothetical protein
LPCVSNVSRYLVFPTDTVLNKRTAKGIEFPNHQGKEAQYIENLRALIKKARKDEVPGVQGLGLVSPAATEPPSEAQTTSERLVYFNECEIGSGTFGRVFRLIRARDGKYFAGKVFTPPGTSKKRRHGETDPAWLTGIRREYNLAKENPHVRFYPLFFLPFLRFSLFSFSWFCSFFPLPFVLFLSFVA